MNSQPYDDESEEDQTVAEDHDKDVPLDSPLSSVTDTGSILKMDRALTPSVGKEILVSF